MITFQEHKRISKSMFNVADSGQFFSGTAISFNFLTVVWEQVAKPNGQVVIYLE
jgi:hypothetical protein